MTKICTILVGPPASGKSTWVYEATKSADKTFILSTDDTIDEIVKLYGLTYNDGFKNLIGFAEQVMWNDLRTFANHGYHLYVDRTNMSVAARKKFIDALKPYGYVFEAVVFPKPEDEDYEVRLNSRPGKTIPEAVINGMLASFQMPTEDEGFESVTVIEN